MNDHLLMRSAVLIKLVSLEWKKRSDSGLSVPFQSGIRRAYVDAHLRDIAKSSGQ